jgi:DNA polymerase III subunit epsilon
VPSWFSFGRQAGPRDPAFASDTPLAELGYAVIDTELTSLDSRKNRLLSIGAIAMDGRKIRMGDPFYRVVNPGVEVPVESVMVHKLRPNDVEQGVAPAVAMAELREFVVGRVLVGHFFHIDLKALRKELGDQQHELSNPAICTARVHRWIMQRGPVREDFVQEQERIDLETLAKAYDLEFRDAHHALEDAFLTARLWQKQMAKLQAMGVQDLGGLLKIAKA